MNKRQYKKYQKKHHYKHWASVKALERMKKLIYSNILFENIKEQILSGSSCDEETISIKRTPIGVARELGTNQYLNNGFMSKLISDTILGENNG